MTNARLPGDSHPMFLTRCLPSAIYKVESYLVRAPALRHTVTPADVFACKPERAAGASQSNAGGTRTVEMTGSDMKRRKEW